MLRNVFQTVDMDNNGMLDIDEFVEVRTHERGVATSAPANSGHGAVLCRP